MPDFRALFAASRCARLYAASTAPSTSGDVRRLARLAAGLEMLAELRPLQLLLAGRRQLVRADVGAGHAVLHARTIPTSAPRRRTRGCAALRAASGLEKSLMPTSRQVSRIISSTSVCSVDSPAVSTMISIGLPSGSRRTPSDAALEPHLVQQLLGCLLVELRPARLVLLAIQRALGTTVLLPSLARPK